MIILAINWKIQFIKKNLDKRSNHFSIRVANTRNPFDRLHAAWTDKFRLNSSFQRTEDLKRVKFIYDAVNVAEEDKYIKPEGFSNSFEAFVKYVLQSTTMTLNWHWRPFFWACRPCQLDYDFVTRLNLNLVFVWVYFRFY